MCILQNHKKNGRLDLKKKLLRRIGTHSIHLTTLIRTKLQAFAYKINFSFLFTNERLMKCNLSETEMGSFCFETRESLVHLFFHCPHVRLIWLQVAHCLQTKCNIDFVISREICILGQGLTNPLARPPGLVIPTFGLA